MTWYGNRFGLSRDCVPFPLARRPAVSVATLLGQGSRQRPSGWHRYKDADGEVVHVVPVTLAGALQLSMPKTLAGTLAEEPRVSAGESDIDQHPGETDEH